MNINDAIARLPQLLKGRFAGNNNAFWINAANDAITEIERCSCGPGRIRTNMAIQLDGGFIPKPSTLFDVKNVKVDGEDIDFTKDDEGIYLNSLDLEYKGKAIVQKSANCRVSSTGNSCSVYLDEDVADGKPFEAMRTVRVNAFNGTNKTFSVTLTAGTTLPTSANGMKGWLLIVNGEQLRVATSVCADGQNATGTVYETSGQIITGAIENQKLAGMESNALAGAEIHSGGDLLQIISSEWVPPTSYVGGWTSPLNWICTLARPVRTFAETSAVILLSNITAEGYRSITRATTLTETLDLPTGSENLLSSYLRWKAEADADLSSPETLRAEAAFRDALDRYSVNQSAAYGKSRPRKFTFTPIFTGRR